MRLAKRLAGLGLLALAGAQLSGCSSSSGAAVTDMLGMGKQVPDERAVRTHQVLAMPPDLSLKPPVAGAEEEGGANAAALEAEAAVGQQALHTPPESILQNAAPAPKTPAYSAAAAAAPQTAVASTQAAAPAEPAGDVYQRYGVSKTNPDGTPKSDAQLNKELRQKRLELEKAKNPNYGSVWNIGNIFN
ncbi:hypothetical protein FHS85_004001 [Rhodoligotrophos appendicifer]|uniref:hypothetical protein n=1 Tax=Rhodoligotrophos appendicifer TaxID=987056 RepID=UPI001478CA26|nr:hypothetical protein [Rhodoligotrophos appendicifer]